MPRLTPIAALLAATVAIVSYPSRATAVTIHKHITVTETVGHESTGPLVVAQPDTMAVRVPPPDSDDDGFTDTEDNCPSDGYTGNGGCTPPPPEPPPAAPAPEATSVEAPVYSSGSCPSSLAGESTSPTAVNGDSGASGCIQALPETWDQYGDPAYAEASDAPVDVQMQAMAAICAAQGNDAWDAADPCG